MTEVREAGGGVGAHPVVLFDGVCRFCHGSVVWIVRRDRAGVFRFAALQSDAGRAVLARAGVAGELPDSVVLVDERGVHVRTDAALGIARGLGLPWSLAGVLRVLPRGVRDWAYNAFARRRYRWFGRTEACLVPTAEIAARFLDAGEGKASAGSR